MKPISFWAILFAIGAHVTPFASCYSAEPPANGTATEQPGQCTLLLDQHTVASSVNLQQRFVAAGKHPKNPLIRRSEPWEGVGPYIWGNRLMQDEKSGLLRLWYIAYHYEGNFYRWGYATSVDGLHWDRPNLAVEKYAGAKARNLLPLGPHPEKGTRSIARDPRPETPADRRYLGVRFTYDGEFVSFSPDGINWREYPQNPVWKVPSDIIHVMWDDRRQRFVAYYKVWELVGRELTANGPAEGTPFIAHMPTFTPKNRGDGATEFEGPCITFQPPKSATVETCKFVLRSSNQGADDGGGTSLSGAWNAKRVQAFAESEDGIHWTNEQVVLRADDRDPPTANIQYMFVTPYGGYYLGFLTLHDEAGHFRIQLAHSADGIHWRRPSRAPWLDVGKEGEFDRGMVLGPADPILWEREMWFPYGGFPIRHDSSETNWESAIGMATMRLDGFACWEAADALGELVTKPFTFDGDRLFVNANANGGALQVEVLDEAGAVIPGFEREACQKITVDTLNAKHPHAGWMKWGDLADPAKLQGRKVQLRFSLRNAKLFSYRVATEATVTLPSPRATTR